jgi:hypothetical protein
MMKVFFAKDFINIARPASSDAGELQEQLNNLEK